MNDKRLVDEINIEFEGRRNSRDVFLDLFFDATEDFFDSHSKEGSIISRILLEIVRNIHDHAYGWGYLTVKKFEGGHIEFEAGNTVLPESEIPKLPEKDWENYGIGLSGGMIFGYAKEIHLELTLDVDVGYVFRGSYKPC